MRKTLIGFLLICILTACMDSNPADKIIRQHHRAVGRTGKIKNLVAFANCQGPDGKYTTKTSSSFTDDYLLFQQDYSYKSPFYAVIYEKSEGFGLDTSLTSQGALSEVVIAVLKGHEFHELMMQPDLRYTGMDLIHDTVFFDQQCHQLRVTDHLGLPVRLYFDQESHLMAGMSQVNPYSKGEVISVHFDKWEKKDGIKIFRKVEIRQGKSDQYLFEFESVEWNAPEFNKLTLK